MSGVLEAVRMRAADDANRAVPDAVALSERAVAALRAAEGHARLLDHRMDNALTVRRLVGAAAGASAGGAALLALAVRLDWIEAGFAAPALIAVAALACVALAAQVWDVVAASREDLVRALASDIASVRQQVLTARRINTMLAGLSLKQDLSPQVRGMMATLLQASEDEIAGLRRRQPGPAVLDGVGLRRHERIVPRQTRTVVKTADGRALTARIADVSPFGVAIETELADVEIGAAVTIGVHPARAVRKLARGMAFEFRTPLDRTTFDSDIVL